LFRIAQEGLSNVVRHSHANRANITLQCSETQAELIISDNGCGFDLRAQSSGIGLLGMRERLRAVNGHLHVASDWHSGTKLRASVPVALGAADAARHAAMGTG
jgi:signal transduction histidine kinase